MAFVVMRRSDTTLVGSTSELLASNSRQNLLLITETACFACEDCPLGAIKKAML